MHRHRLIRIFMAMIASVCLLGGPARALTQAEASAIATGETDARIAALNKAMATADDKTAAFIQAMADGDVKLAGDQVFIVKDGKGSDPVTGAAVPVPDAAEDIINNNRMRGELDNALAALKLFSKDDKQRMEGVKALLKEPDEARLPLVEKALAAESNPAIKAQLELARAAALLGSADKTRRLDAARALGQNKTPETKLLLNERMKVETEPEVKAQLEASLRADRELAGLGRQARRTVLGHQPGLHPAAGGAGPGHHLRPDGRHQHGARRTHDDWRLRHLRRAGPVPEVPARRLRLVPAGRRAGGLHGVGAGGRGAGAQRDPVPLRPAAGDAAGHLGHQPDADAGRALDLWRAERRRGKPLVDERRRAGAVQPAACPTTAW